MNRQAGEAKPRIAGGRYWLALNCVLVVGASGPLARTAQIPAIDHPGLNLKITVRVYNYAQLSRERLAKGERKAADVLGRAGVQVAWVDCPLLPGQEPDYPACGGPWAATDFVLRVLPRAMTERMAFHAEASGFAATCGEGVRGCIASVFYDRLQELAEGSGAYASSDIPLILGDAIAHENGHLLLGPNSHSATGIMCARWDRKYLQRALMAGHFFTPEQAGIIRTEVQTRMEQARAVPTPSLALK